MEVKLFIILFFISECSATSIRYPSVTAPCIMIDMDANITLIGTSGNSMFKEESTLDEGATSSGTCPGTGSSGSVDFVVTSGAKGNLGFLFVKGSDSRVTMELTYTFVPDTIFINNDTKPIVVSDLGSTQMGMDTESYTCTGPKTITFGKQNTTDYVYEMTMVISSVKIQAFNFNGTDFAPAIDCTEIDGLTTSQNVGSSEGQTSEAPTAPPVQTTEPPTATSNDTSTLPQTKPSNHPTEPSTGRTSETPTTMPQVGPTTNPRPTVPPTPLPGSPETVTYRVNNSASEGTCLVFQAGIEFVIPYQAKKWDTTKTLGIDSIGHYTSFQGDCHPATDNTTQTLEITFYNVNNLTLTFSQDAENYYVSEVDLNIDINQELFPDAITLEKRSIRRYWGSSNLRATNAGTYKCKEKLVLLLGLGFEMHTYNLQYAAFKKNYTDFDKTEISECPTDKDKILILYIAIGSGFVVVLIIVVIACISIRCRRKEHKRPDIASE